MAQPLKGAAVLLLREKLGREKERLKRLGAQVIHCPALQRRIAQSVPGTAELARFHWVAFTSSFGVETVARASQDRWPVGVKAACVGPKTEAALCRFFRRHADFIPCRFTTQALAKELPIRRGDSVLLIRSGNADTRMEGILRRRGARVSRRSVYRVESAAGFQLRSLTAGRRITHVLFGSATQVRSFLVGVGKKRSRAFFRSGVCALAIGPETSKALRKAGIPHRSAKVHTFDGVVDLLLEWTGHVS